MEQERKNWNNFIIENEGSLLQSYEWGIFQQSLGKKIWRLDLKNQVAGLIIKNQLPLGKSYFYCPYGPVIKKSQGLKLFFDQLAEIAQAEKAIFLKIEPGLSIKNNQLVKADNIQPKKTLILDITASAEEILAQMHSKTRYNIRLAQKKGIEIEMAESPNTREREIFWNLANQTAQRDHFKLYDQEYYEKMLSVLAAERMIKLFLAKYQNKIIAAIIIGLFGQTAYYLHGASDYQYRKLMAPHLLQWQAILKAKILGYRYYDFWGIDQHQWPGVTRFKNGFGGTEINYPQAYNLVWQPKWYQLYHLVKKYVKGNH